MSKFLHEDAKAIAIPPVFLENSRAKKLSTGFVQRFKDYHKNLHWQSSS